MMKTITTSILAISSLASGYCLADAPQLHVRKTMVIDAEAAKVWQTARNFDGLAVWHPAVEKDQLVEGSNNTVGAVRLLTLKGGGTIKEKLVGFDDAARRFRYVIVEGVLPVSAYTSTFTVTSVSTNKTSVAWSGNFKRKNVGDNPAEDENDKTAIVTIGGVYKAGLDNLKKIAEAK